MKLVVYKEICMHWDAALLLPVLMLVCELWAAKKSKED